MKKLFLLTPVLGAIILLSACHVQSPETSVEESFETEVSSAEESLGAEASSTEDSSKFEEVSDGFMNETISRDSFESYDAYQQHMDSHTVPDSFIEYEQLAALGSFDSLIILSSDYNHYLYTMKDTNDYYVSLYVDHVPTEHSITSSYVPKILTTSQVDDLRQYPSKTSGHMSLNGLEYVYIQGDLLSIRWVHDGIKFTLCSGPKNSESGMLDDYPIGGKTFTSKMLSASQSAAAAQSFNQQVLDQHMTE